MSGLILLVFLAVIVAWFWNKGRRKIGLPINSKTWTGVIVVVVLALLLFWASSQGKH